jgi:hypothetical protein
MRIAVARVLSGRQDIYVCAGALYPKMITFSEEKIGEVCLYLGGPLIKGAESSQKEEKHGGIVSGTISVIGGGLVSATTVWIALEDAAKSLASGIAHSTVHVVQHR